MVNYLVYRTSSFIENVLKRTVFWGSYPIVLAKVLLNFLWGSYTALGRYLEVRHMNRSTSQVVS